MKMAWYSVSSLCEVLRPGDSRLWSACHWVCLSKRCGVCWVLKPKLPANPHAVGGYNERPVKCPVCGSVHIEFVMKE